MLCGDEGREGKAGIRHALDEQAREVDALRSQLRRVRAEIHAWPDDNATYRSLLADMRELQRLLDEKLPPATDPLSPA
jgi:uncharacterized protein involved in exopolysaccharide biosynthesis